MSFSQKVTQQLFKPKGGLHEVTAGFWDVITEGGRFMCVRLLAILSLDSMLNNVSFAYTTCISRA